MDEFAQLLDRIAKLPDMPRAKRHAAELLADLQEALAREDPIAELLQSLLAAIAELRAEVRALRGAEPPAAAGVPVNLTAKQREMVMAPVHIDVAVVRDPVTERIRRFGVTEGAPGAPAASVLARPLPHPAEADEIQRQLTAIQAEMKHPRRYAKNAALQERYRQLLELAGAEHSAEHFTQ